ncbi:MAG: 3-isopropylmalate dehydrogenase [Alphaproteobacteria bacterium]|nr:3-isopropylmalate dehydrogenase [Alphaproteobacteria bacterium]
MTTKKILILAGDCIGPEVMVQARRVLDWFNETSSASFEFEEGLVGGASFDAHGTPLTDETVNLAKAADAVLFGSIGGPKWDGVDYDLRPENGLLRLRKAMGLFANLRPAIVFDALAGASSLKTDLVSGLDIMIVRELIGGIYFGEPRGIEDLPNGEQRGYNTQSYATDEVVRIAHVAFDLARKRDRRVCSVDKANVMESGVVWRDVTTTLRDESYTDVDLSHMFVDNCAMQLVRTPKQFDVILTDNLFGDILSDLAAMLTGSLGMLPSASFGAADEDGRQPALYEPVHGSAPDIAGQNIGNPLAQILSTSMMLRYSFDMKKEADLVENAVEAVLSKNIRTGDIAADGVATIGTSQMGDAVLAEMAAVAG